MVDSIVFGPQMPAIRCGVCKHRIFVYAGMAQHQDGDAKNDHTITIEKWYPEM